MMAIGKPFRNLSGLSPDESGKNTTKGVKTDLGVLAKGRKLQETDYGYQLREVSFPYEDQIGRKKEEIGINNTYLW